MRAKGTESNEGKALRRRRAFPYRHCASVAQQNVFAEIVLFWRSWGEYLAPSGLGFRFGFRCLLRFFPAFVFASHEKKHDTNAREGKG